MQQIQAGKLDLNATVASYLPAFASNGKGDITIEQLLTHTSGLPADPSPALWTYATMPERIAAIMNTVPQYPAGTTYLYSDLNMLTLQQVLQQITGKTLDVLVRQGITAPLGMKDTMYNPPASLKPRIAAEEYELGPGEPQRGLVWGSVHDENAWAMGGVAGHAGVFSTVSDMAVLAQAILNGGTYQRAPDPEPAVGHHAGAELQPEASPATRTVSASNSTSAGTWAGWTARSRWATPASPAPRSSSTRCRARSRCSSATGCTRPATGVRPTRRAGRGRRRARRCHGGQVAGRRSVLVLGHQ